MCWTSTHRRIPLKWTPTSTHHGVHTVFQIVGKSLQSDLATLRPVHCFFWPFSLCSPTPPLIVRASSLSKMMWIELTPPPRLSGGADFCKSSFVRNAQVWGYEKAADYESPINRAAKHGEVVAAFQELFVFSFETKPWWALEFAYTQNWSINGRFRKILNLIPCVTKSRF